MVTCTTPPFRAAVRLNSGVRCHLDSSMRPEISDPTACNSSLQEALALSDEIYRLHEEGQDYSAPLRRLARIAKRPIGPHAVLAAFGSIRPITFAKKQLVDWNSLPNDLAEEEMLDLIQRVCQSSGSEFQTEYWVECLRINTGDENISDLIFWPGEYFHDGDNSRELSPSDILRTLN